MANMRVTQSLIAQAYFGHLSTLEVEEFWAIALNSKKQVLARACLFKGTVDSCSFHPRDLFRFAYLENSVSLIVAHNHPHSGSNPSEEDIEVTENILWAGKILQIDLLDHLILGSDGYFSFADNGLLDQMAQKLLRSPWIAALNR